MSITRSFSGLHLWLILLCVCAGYSGFQVISNKPFEGNILGLLPGSSENNLHTKLRQLQQKKFDRQFAFLVRGESPAVGTALTKNLANHIQNTGIAEIKTESSFPVNDLLSVYFPRRFQLLDNTTREWLKSSTAEEIAQQTYTKLYGLSTAYQPHSFTDDPFNLSGAFISELLSFGAHFQPGEFPSIKADGAHWHILQGQLSSSPFDLSTQQEISKALDKFTAENRQQSAQILKSGLVFHAIEGTEIAQSEISTVGLGSLAGIVLLVFLVFNSWRSTLAILFTLGSSSLIALTVCLLIFDKVHLITLAFGTTLLGLAADYCFHFLVKHHSCQNSGKAIALIRKSLLFGAASSICAYLLQLYSPFPGLQQFAVFVASGLSAACLSVFLLGSHFKDNKAGRLPHISKIYSRNFEPMYKSMASHRGLCLTLLSALLCTSVFLVIKNGTDDDLRSLNTSSNKLISSEQKVQHLLRIPDYQRYYIIEGSSQEEMLQSIEQWNQVRYQEGSQSLSAAHLIPSVTQQHGNFKLVLQKLYDESGALPILCNKLSIDCSIMRRPEPFSALTIDAFPENITNYWPELSLLKENIGVLFQPKMSTQALVDLKSYAEKKQDINYTDQIRKTSSMLAEIRRDISGILLGFAVLLACLCWLFFKANSVIILISLLVSATTALAVSTASGVTLFHVLALLLVIGISIDTTAFYLKPGLDQDTWLAATLSSMTSLLAFGLLSFSSVPILHQFGLIVSSGLICSWLVSPLIFFLFSKKRSLK